MRTTFLPTTFGQLRCSSDAEVIMGITSQIMPGTQSCTPTQLCQKICKLQDDFSYRVVKTLHGTNPRTPKAGVFAIVVVVSNTFA
eukprot:909040-Amphidinium_carterae.1